MVLHRSEQVQLYKTKQNRWSKLGASLLENEENSKVSILLSTNSNRLASMLLMRFGVQVIQNLHHFRSQN